MKMKIGLLTLALSLCGSITFDARDARADHSWNNYHWARTGNPMPLKVIDSVSEEWQFEFDTALGEWNQSSKLNMSVDSADDSNRARKQCKSVLGQMRVCNASYGYNGWLGLASINLDSNGHITRGTAKVNDSYSSYWANSNEKRHVMCQEVGHVFGLGHTSEDGSTQDTCMDYSSDPNSISPNSHDYDLLDDIYTHLDAYNSYGSDDGDGGNTKPCRGNNPNCTPLRGPEIPPMGVRVHKGEHHEVWAASGRNGSIWIHHIRLVPEEYR
jgi:hypothetical protein